MKTTPKEKAFYIANLASNKKAQDIVILDMHKISTFCDYFVICSGSSHRMIKAICDEIEEELHKKHKISPDHIEGLEKEPTWILVDYGDVVAHIFHEEARSFYDLEWLWNDAKKLTLSE